MKHTVVVGYDQSPSGDRALAQAGREAAWRDAGVTVVTGFHWIAVPSPMGYMPADIQTPLQDAAEKVAADGVRWLRRHYPGMPVDSAVISGPTADAIAEASRDAEVLVLGNRGRGGFAGLLLGSVSMRTLTLASCPTMVVRGEPREPADSVVLALDIEDAADSVIGFAFTEAAARGARLRAISAWDLGWTRTAEPEGAAGLDTAKARFMTDIRTTAAARLNPWQAKFPDVRCTIEAADEPPSAVLTRATQTADLIVAGAHRRADGHLGMRPGPIVHTLLHQAECPVAVVPR
ncbi:nucleotide-binding universal stress UspA family protein [Catenulispora sp. MAP12-49]|uniref:universal stress protein n=1 Tax=Catenulispora sp. MAP12-49 TaxID=3156302 RepID=UPI0035132729